MNTSPATSMLSKPEGANPIPLGTLAYFRGRNRWRAFDVVLSEFQKSGLSKADLARRLGKRPEVISRLLGAPGNWGLDTVSDLLFAISGGEPDYSVSYPLDMPAKNYRQPEWLDQPTDFHWVETVEKRQTQIQQETLRRFESHSVDFTGLSAAKVPNEDHEDTLKSKYSASDAGLVAAG